MQGCGSAGVWSWSGVLEAEVDAEVGAGVADRQGRELFGDLDRADRGAVEDVGAAPGLDAELGDVAGARDAEVDLDVRARLRARGRRPVASDLRAHDLQVVGELEAGVVHGHLAGDAVR